MWWGLFIVSFWALTLQCDGDVVVGTFNATAQPSPFATPVPTLLKIAPPFISPDEEQSILSVTVWFKLPATTGAIFHYTLDGSTPTLDSPSVGNGGGPVMINKLGVTVVKCFATKEGMEDSVVVTRSYTILGRCAPPFINPNYGTFENEVVVKFHTPTLKGRICYTVDSRADPNKDATCVADGGSVLINTAGRHTVRAIIVADGMADSSETEATLHIVMRVAAPVITPEIGVFPIIAMLTVKCSTPDATMYYTLDRTVPTLTSLTITNGNNIVVDTIGSHTLKVLATAPGKVNSNITTKDFTIQRRMVEPLLLPRPGTYTGDLVLTLQCPEAIGEADSTSATKQQGRVYYTLDGVRTPSDKSDSVLCGETITLTAPRTITVRAIALQADKAASSVVQGVYVLVRPKYEEHPVNPVSLETFSVQPDVSIIVVEKNIPEVRSYCSARNQRGRLIVLRNPVGHFDIVPPAQGCNSGKLELPSVSGRHFQPAQGFNLTSYIESRALRRKLASQSVAERVEGSYLRKVATDVLAPELPGSEEPPEDVRLRLDHTRRSELPVYLKTLLEKGNESTIRVSTLEHLGERYGQVEHLGCQIVSNAGFFNVTSRHCLGDIVTTGNVQQLSDLHNVNFGIRNGSFVVGYVEKEEILDPARPPFDFLVSGLGWLVRGGKSYVSESFSSQGDKESMAAQSNGPQFLSVHSARTALGHDAEGNLLLLQVEGQTWVRGMSLYEFADFAVELGFYSAINLDGGGSATLTQNHSLISEPSWKCSEAPYNSSEFYRCEKRVSSITCIHAMAPPFVDAAVIDKYVHPRSPAPTAGPTAAPSASPTTLPSVLPTVAPTPNSTEGAGSDDKNSINSTAVDRQLLVLQSSVRFYELSAVTLLVILLFSIGGHLLTCVYYYDAAKRKARLASANRSEPPRNEAEPPSPGGLQMMPTTTALESPKKFPPAPFQFSPPSQGISSQYSAIPSDGPAKSPGGILSYLPSLTSSASKRLGETQPEPAPRNVATSPRSLSRHQSQQHQPQQQQQQQQPEEELRDIADWKPPGSGLLLAHSAPVRSATSGSASASAATAGYSFGRSKEEEDFYRDDDEDEDCTDSSRLLRAPGAPAVKASTHGAHNSSGQARRSRSGDSDSGSSEEGQGGFLRRPVGLKVPKSSGKLKAKPKK